MIRKTLRAALGFAALLVLAAAPAAAYETEAQQAILVDWDTGAVLFEKNADELMHPSSMSKMMTLYMLFEKLQSGAVKLDDEFTVSEKAWRKGGSKMFVEVGAKVKVEDLIRGIIVQSGNDACIVVAEALGGTEEAFAEQMTRRGREMGLTGTVFKNSTGWPDPEHLTTARDLALLARHTIADFPGYYRYYSEINFTFHGIKQGNRNPLLYKDTGADWLKTGHTEDGGFGIAASAERGERRLIMVLNGLPSMKARAEESERMMNWGFREFDNYALFKGGEAVSEAEVWLGDAATVPLTALSDITVTLPRKARRQMKVSVTYDGPVPAPIKKGEEIAELVIAAPDMDRIAIPLAAGSDVGQLGFAGRVMAALKHIVWGRLQ